MVRKVAALIMWTLATACLAQEVCTQGSEFEPPLCSSKLAAAGEIKIFRDAAASQAANLPRDACKTFVLNEHLVRDYLQRAKLTNESDAHHTLDWSPCYGAGQVEFVDGRKATWTINQFRIGEVIFDKEKMLLYCPDCRFLPFQ